jgi:hypothetical protein
LVQAFKFDRGVIKTQRQEGDLISLLVFFKNKESRLKRQSFPCDGLIKHHAMSTHGEVEV